MDTELWFDNHPVISDLIILVLPGLSIFLMWMTFGFGFRNSIIQAIMTTIVLGIVFIYLSRKHNNTIFRYIDI